MNAKTMSAWRASPLLERAAKRKRKKVEKMCRCRMKKRRRKKRQDLRSLSELLQRQLLRKKKSRSTMKCFTDHSILVSTLAAIS